MPNKEDFLLEIGCEELPPKPLVHYTKDLCQGLVKEFAKVKLPHGEIEVFATPRRLALLVHDVPLQQERFEEVRKGPNYKAAFDSEGKPTAAALGFARACGVAFEEIIIPEATDTQPCLSYRYSVGGKAARELLPGICQNAVALMSIPKPMRWGAGEYAFIRPVHWIVMLYGTEIVAGELFGVASCNETRGHRYHHPQAITIPHARDYAALLEKTGYVIADFQRRKQMIRESIIRVATEHKVDASIDENLLDEVTGLVEWPVVMSASFDPAFLRVPKEALISAMKVHQKAFPVLNADGQLQPYFIFVANIQSEDPKRVVIGNERVMSARLADAAFFYQSDSQHRLEHRLDALKQIVFQAKLGTLYDKSQRVANLAALIAEQIAETNKAHRAGLLCKCDLTSDMVKEFPELQGIMGAYYAEGDGELPEVALAIREHYYPRFAGDQLPTASVGDAVALADRLDTLVGIFALGQQPTGDKDPFALRRAALGILRIIIEHGHSLNLVHLLENAHNGYPQPLINQAAKTEAYQFIIERLHGWYQDRGISPIVLNAVLAAKNSQELPLDIHHRVLAIDQFRQFPEAIALAVANKRASNILMKAGVQEKVNQDPFAEIDTSLFEDAAEKELYQAIKALQTTSENLTHILPTFEEYCQRLKALAMLREPVDKFFDQVLVMHENEAIRQNRFVLLAALRALFLGVADIAKLQD